MKNVLCLEEGGCAPVIPFLSSLSERVKKVTSGGAFCFHSIRPGTKEIPPVLKKRQFFHHGLVILNEIVRIVKLCWMRGEWAMVFVP